MRLQTGLLALLLLVVTVPASPAIAADGQGMTGNALWDNYCGFQVDSPAGVVCSTYIGGSISTLNMIRETVGVKLYCPPPSVTTLDEIDIARSYIRDTPSQRQFSAVSLVFVALRRAYPCASAPSGQ